MSDRELEELIGEKPAAKIVFILHGERLFRRDAGGWYEYPPYPDTSTAVVSSESVLVT